MLLVDDHGWLEASGPAYPAVLFQELVSFVAAIEATALHGLAEELLGEGEEGRDEEKNGGDSENPVGLLLQL